MMKEVEKKDAPEVSGGTTLTDVGWLPLAPNPLPDYPPSPASPTDPLDPLGDKISKNQVQS
jgi:hypothetical protein